MFRKGIFKGLIFNVCSVAIIFAGISIFFPAQRWAAGSEILGRYFSKQKYAPEALPNLDKLRSELPSPIYDDNPQWVKTYWKAWELLFQHFRAPAPQSGFVSQFTDFEPSWHTVGEWDFCFISMFSDYAYPHVPGIRALDNFYARQHEDGEISREIDWRTGEDLWPDREDKPLFSRNGWPREVPGPIMPQETMPVHYVGREAPSPNPRLTLDGLDNPTFAWAELEHYKMTGDQNRLAEVWEPLVHYYAALQKFLRQGNGLYMTDWASMDNAPRNFYLSGGGTAIDTSSQMVLFARQLAQIAEILGKKAEAKEYSMQADQLAKIINRLMWDPKTRFYYDLTLEGRRAPIKTIAAYWTLLARVASPSQAATLAAELRNPHTFGQRNLVPTVAAHQPGYDPQGGFWRGGVWPMTNAMVVAGLENYGYEDLARAIALNYVSVIANVFSKTGTIWDDYSPEKEEPADDNHRDFYESGMGPIKFFLEYAVGLSPDAPNRRLLWDLKPGGRRGCDRFRFADIVVSLVAEPDNKGSKAELISVTSDTPFELDVRFQGVLKRFSVARGKQAFELYPKSSKQ